MATKELTPKYHAWIDVRKRFHLSHVQVQMGHELGLNPNKFGELANDRQELWKQPLLQFIHYLYFKRFQKERPDTVLSNHR